MAATVNVATPAPTVNVVPLNVPDPLVFVHTLPLYPSLNVGVTVLKSNFDPYSKFFVIVAVPVFVHPLNATLLIPFPAFKVILYDFTLNVAFIVVSSIILPLVFDQLLKLYPVLLVAVTVFNSLVVVPVVTPFSINLLLLTDIVVPLITL